MLTRFISGLAGLAVVIFVFTWPNVFSASSDSLLITVSGFLMAVVVTLGVYLMFYSLTGDWLPNFRKRKDNS